ncbi:DUF4365 domain-containing protein [Pseudomonas mosselii]|uniref:DUF4365 domain-containing protein n=1 Tax=Pseudomonas mosselii TaxID=78327 RepID=UPI0032E44E6A
MPKRKNEHRVETESNNILRELIVSVAIFRELSEKDYGVDGVIEFFNSDGSMCGAEVLVQIKGSRNVPVKKGLVKTPSIRTDTIRYWAQKKQSVFILLVDVSRRLIYFEDAKYLARVNAKKIQVQKTISFSISEGNVIDAQGNSAFRKEVFISDKFDQSKAELAKLIFGFREIYKQLIVNAGRDCFMVLDHDDPRIDLLNGMSESFQLCWYFFRVHAEMHDFYYFLKLSYEAWRCEVVEMHVTETADYLREQFHYLLLMVIARKNTYSMFWEENDRKVINRLDKDFDLMLEVAKGNVGFHNVEILNEYFL